MKTYFLKHDIYFCGQGDAVVFLDLKQDEYSMLYGRDAEVFRSCFMTQPARGAVPESPEPETCSPEAVARVVRELTQNGILTTQQSGGKEIVPTRVEAARISLIPHDYRLRRRISSGTVIRFVAACLMAAWRLRMQPLYRTVSAISRRKPAGAGASLNSERLGRAQDLVAAFNRLRGLFPRSYLCLFDSLALLEFLARYDVYPEWIFAVQVEPWSAHCWVQDGEVIFNDDLEETSDYIPIMAV